MPHVPWDQVLVYLIVTGAALYLAWGTFGKGRKGACGGCDGCGSTRKASRPASTPLVQLEARPHTRPTRARVPTIPDREG